MNLLRISPFCHSALVNPNKETNVEHQMYMCNVICPILYSRLMSLRLIWPKEGKKNHFHIFYARMYDTWPGGQEGTPTLSEWKIEPGEL